MILGDGGTWRWLLEAEKNKVRCKYKIKMMVISKERPTKLGSIGGITGRGDDNGKKKCWIIVEKGGVTIEKRPILTSSGRADLVAVDSLAELAMVSFCMFTLVYMSRF